MKKNTNNRIGLGTAAIGRPLYINLKQEEDNYISKEAFRQKGIVLLNEAYNQGVRYFDTAPGYGMAEQMLIDWVEEKGDSNIEIATKWGYTYVADFDPNATNHEVKEHSLNKLKEQWTKSKQLIPWLTTYQIHSATLETGVLDNKHVLHHLADLKSKHDLHISITTTSDNQTEVLKKALKVEIEGIELFDAFQITYNIFDQDLASMVDVFVKNGKRLIIKEALANGRIFSNNQYLHYEQAYRYLNKLAKKYSVGVDAIALRFCMDTLPVYKVLSGAANSLHLSANMKTLDFKLEPVDLDLLKELSIPPKEYWIERKQLGWN